MVKYFSAHSFFSKRCSSEPVFTPTPWPKSKNFLCCCETRVLLASFPFSIDDVRVDVRLFHQRERGSNPRRVNLHHTNKILNRLNIQLVCRLDRVWGVFFSRKKNFLLSPPLLFSPFRRIKKMFIFWLAVFLFQKEILCEFNRAVRVPPPSMTPRGFEPRSLWWKCRTSTRTSSIEKGNDARRPKKKNFFSQR